MIYVILKDEIVLTLKGYQNFDSINRIEIWNK